jgi:hypothetical protein
MSLRNKTKTFMHLSKTEQNIGTTISSFVILLFSVYILFGTLGMENEIVILSAIGISFLVSFLFCFSVQFHLRKKNNLVEIDYLNIGTQRYFLGLFMIFYGVPKLLGDFFDYQLFALDTRLVDVSEFELAWYFFGKNRWQELFAGIMEFIPGIMLLNRRTYYLASIVLLPVTAQVFILNLFFKIGGLTFPAATILLACNIYIIFSQKEKIIHFIKSLEFSRKVSLTGQALRFIKLCRWIIIGLAVFISVMKIKNEFLKSDYRIKYEKLIGSYTLVEMKQNKMDYSPINDSLYYKDLYIEKQGRWNILRRFNNQTDAFILNLNATNDSISIYINKGGIGDAPDIIDSLTVLEGIYKLDNNILTITGIQLKDTLQLKYTKQDLSPKEWFW